MLSKGIQGGKEEARPKFDAATHVMSLSDSICLLVAILARNCCSINAQAILVQKTRYLTRTFESVLLRAI